MARLKNRNQLYKVEIKSMAIIREGQKGFITYFKGGTHEDIINNLRVLYPQFMNPTDHPVVNITAISKGEYNRDRNTKMVHERQAVVSDKAHIMKEEDYEVMEN